MFTKKTNDFDTQGRESQFE